MTPFTIDADITKRDNICAISTPPGIGGIAVCRVAGPDAIKVVDSLWSGKSLSSATTHTAHLGTILDENGQPLDQCVATIFRAPGSFTGDDTVEISVHGSRYVQAELINTLCKAGCRLAQPGEFTRRAYASGHLDLTQAEAVADIIASRSRADHRIAMQQLRGSFSKRLNILRDQLLQLASLLELELDFSEEDVEFASRDNLLKIAVAVKDEVTHLHDSFAAGQAIKEGIPVAIIGPTNAGKSSLLNALLGDDRAIVSDIHGTTRDTVEELFTLGDYTIRLIDTAGLRQTTDTIERIGIERSMQALSKARIVILVADITTTIPDDLMQLLIQASERGAHPIIALNKIDLLPAETTGIDAELAPALSKFDVGKFGTDQIIQISAHTGVGLQQLRDKIHSLIAADTATGAADDIIITNRRHATALAQAAASASDTIDALQANLPGDLVAQHLRLTIAHLSTITGDIPSSEILATIFSRFCIGK